MLYLLNGFLLKNNFWLQKAKEIPDVNWKIKLVDVDVSEGF